MVSKRARIIELGKQGLTRQEVMATLVKEGYTNVTYSYVYIVLKDKNIEVPTKVREGKSTRSRILELGREGLTRSEIVKVMKEEGFTNANYNYVYMILKQAGITPPASKMDTLKSKIDETVEKEEPATK